MMKRLITLLLALAPMFLVAQPMDFSIMNTLVSDCDFKGMSGIAVGQGGANMNTQDGGVTWHGAKSPMTGLFNGISMADATTGWAVGAGGVVLRTTNGGLNWTQQAAPTTLNLTDVYAVSPLVAYACGGPGGTGSANVPTVIKTVDGGANWTACWTEPTIPAGLKGNATSGTLYFSSLNAITFTSATTGYICGNLSSVPIVNGGGGKIAKTTDGGLTWTVTNFLSTNHSLRNISFADANNGWAIGNFPSATSMPPGVAPGHLTRTTDGGATWTPLDTVILNFTIWVGVAGLSTDPSKVFAINQTNNTIAKSTDGGVTWTSQTLGSVAGGFSSVRTDGSTVYITGLAGNIHKSTDFGATWTQLNGGTAAYGMYDIHFADSNNGMTCGDGGRIKVTEDGGASWTELLSASTGTSTSLQSVFMTSQTSAVAVGLNTGVTAVKLTKTGGTWTGASVTIAGGATTQNDVFFVDPNTGWSVGNTGTISKTTDGGTTWTQQTSTTTQTVNAVHFVDGNLGFAVTSGSTTNWHKILRTTDGGATWDSVPSPAARRLSLFDVHFVDGNVGYIGGNSLTTPLINSVFMKTVDGGLTWTLLPTPGITGIIQDVYPISSTNVVVSVAGKYFYTADGGATALVEVTPILFSIVGNSITSRKNTDELFFAHGASLPPANGHCVVKATLQNYYADTDGDGFGTGTGTLGFAPLPGLVANNTDCNDSDATIHPNATEICDNIDQDCDMVADDGLTQNTFYADTDGDGFGNAAASIISCLVTVAGYVSNSTDCNDANNAIHPNATETCNSVDDNCNTMVDDGLPTNTFYQDSDGDGFGNAAVSTTTCYATVAGYVADNTDCNDANNAVYPGATEICNGINDDCDGFLDEPLAGSAVATPANCGGASGSVNVTPSCGVAPYTYLWSNGATTEDLTGVAGGIYTVTMTDSQGLTKTLSAVVTGPVAPWTITSFTYVKPDCPATPTGQITCNPAAGYGTYTYSWSNGGSTKKILNVAAGTYTVSVNSSLGCQITGTATLVDPTPLTATSVATAASCPGATNGSVDATVAGGTGAKTYLWSSGQTTVDISGLTAGMYTLTATDAKGCTATTSATVTDASTLALSTVATNITCFGLTNGAATASSTGGVTPKTYAWSNGGMTASISALASGTYTVSVTDGAGCTKTATATVVEPTQVTIAVTSVVQLATGKWRVNLAGAGGTPYPTGAPRRFQRCTVGGTCSSFGSNAYFTNLNPGNYIFTVKDFKGCTASVAQTVPPPPTAEKNAGGSKTEKLTTEKAAENRGNQASEIHFAAAPNPFSNHVKLSAEEAIEQNLKVKMYDMTGRLLLESNWAAGTRTTEINTAALQTGVYFIKVVDSANTVRTTIKVVKTN